MLDKLANIYCTLVEIKESSASSPHATALAEAGLECFQKKVGDWSADSDELGVFNLEMVFCAAYLDPFIRVRLTNMCQEIPRLRMEQVRFKFGDITQREQYYTDKTHCEINGCSALPSKSRIHTSTIQTKIEIQPSSITWH